MTENQYINCTNCDVRDLIQDDRSRVARFKSGESQSVSVQFRQFLAHLKAGGLIFLLVLKNHSKIKDFCQIALDNVRSHKIT